MSTHPNTSSSRQATEHRRTAGRGDRRTRRQEQPIGMIQPLPHHGLLEFSVLAHELKQPLMVILSNAQATQRLLTMAPPGLTDGGADVDDIIAFPRRTDDMIQRLP